MIRSLTFGVLLVGVLTVAQAGLLVTSEQGGKQLQQYFEDGAFVLMQGGRPRFGVDRGGDCWFIQQGRLVADPCDRMLDSMRAMRDQAMAGLGPHGRAIVDTMLQTPMVTQAMSIAASGSKTVAGYPAECHDIGGAREVCLSAELMREVQDEMGSSRFTELLQQFGSSVAEFGGHNAQAKALAELYQRGFPVLDMQKKPSGPGINPAVLQYLPEAQRAQIMQQFGGDAAGSRMQGTRVIRVQKGMAMPTLGLADYPRIGFEEFIQKSMGQIGGMQRQR